MYQSATIDRKRNPRERAGFFTILSFLYTWNIFKTTQKRELIEDDLFEPLRDCETAYNGDRLEFEWEKEVKSGRNSMTRAIFRVFGKNYAILGFGLMVIKLTNTTANPLMIGKFVSYFSPDSTMTQAELCMWAAALISLGLIATLFDQHYRQLMSILGIKIKASLVSLLYRKSLRLTSASLMEVTSGKLVTLMSKDVASFEIAMEFFHNLWVGVMQLFIVNYIMYQQIQEASFVGIALLVALIPLQVYIAKFTKIMRYKMATRTDERLKRMQEILTSIKLLKFYNWSGYYTKLTNAIRIEEVKKLRITFYLKVIVHVLSQLSQKVSFYLCIMFYMYQGNLITTEKTFIIQSCYDNLNYVLVIAVPMCISQFAEARTALKRLKQALLSLEVPTSETLENNLQTVNEKSLKTARQKIYLKGATVDFLGNHILTDINFEAKPPELIAITGNVGSGKSTFLKMLLKEFHTIGGCISITGSLSYASQDPWLFPGTIKQNILFGQTFNLERYQKVLRSCALIHDLENFPMKDNTVVIDKGLNLSKGQQARINLARAVYREADIYLLDDVMVSLDATVSKYIFENCFQEMLKDKLVVFVCHHEKFLKMTDRILVFNKGRIQAQGNYKDLKNQGVDFFVDSIDSNFESDEIIDDEKTDGKSAILDSSKIYDQRLYLEGKQEGKVKFSVYKAYLDSAGGYLALIITLLVFSGAQGIHSYFDSYITNWLYVEEKLSKLMFNISHNLSDITFEDDTYKNLYEQHIMTIYIYSALIGLLIISTIIVFFTFFSFTTRASRVMHNTIFAKVSSATMTFFDKNLSGNILNRFSKDIGAIDESIPFVLYMTLLALFRTVGSSVVITIASPILIAPTICMLALMLLARKSFLVASRGLKRLDGTTRAPVVGFLNSSLESLPTIRASGNQNLLTRQFERHQDLNTSALYMFYSIVAAFGFWMDFVCKLYIGGIIFFYVFTGSREEGSGAKIGLVLSQASGLVYVLEWGIRQWSDLENQMTCVERVQEYADITQETTEGQNPNNWPNKGHIKYRNVHMSYFTGQPVLTNVNFEVLPGERVGIVGRTGAGKSSIISALFRLYDIKGSIIIDDIDIKDIELSILRSKISIIPQDPVLFTGTIRSNLDPGAQHTDDQLWKALGEVELKKEIEYLKEGLSTQVQEGGGNFSVGQRQLISLARAVLSDNKILVLDEATANIDPSTDALIQKTIRKLFAHCTILTIAHRLHTVIDSDRILVVDNGEVVDYDTPQKLVERESGLFYKMAKQIGLVNQLQQNESQESRKQK